MHDTILAVRKKKQPSNVWGLKWIPTLEPEISDDSDWIYTGSEMPPHFTSLDHNVLGNSLLSIPNPKLIVEIGVDRSGSFDASSTGTLIKNKPKDCVYLGIDINDKSYLNDPKNNVYTIIIDSANRHEVYDYIKHLGCGDIDLMFVDGWHSVNQVLKEWEYWESISDKGIMIFHDTNCHPGPIAVLDAADEEFFDVEYFGRMELDWGIGVVKRK